MKFEIGEKYIINFEDHCKGDAVIVCQVMIKITKQTKTSISGTWWILIRESQETEDANSEIITIIKSTIIKKRKIK